MSKLLKSTETNMNENLAKELIGKIIHVPVNNHLASHTLTGTSETINVWFAGTVAGFEKSYISYDFNNEKFLDEPVQTYNIYLTDGMCYILSTDEVEIYEITEEEFKDLVEKTQVEREAQESIITPESLFKGGEGFEL